MAKDFTEAPDPDYGGRKRPGKKDPLLRIFKGLLALFVFALLMHTITLFATNRMVDLEMKKLKAKGIPASFPEMLGPALAPQTNAAEIYTQAFQRIDLLAQQKADANLVNYPSLEKRLADPALLAKTRKDLRQYGEVISLARKAADQPRCQFPVDWSKGPATLLPHLGSERALSRVLAADALIKAHDGKIDEALQSTALIYTAANHLKEDPCLIGMLVRCASVRIGGGALRETLAWGDPSEAEARRLYSLLGKSDFSGAFKRATEGEMLNGIITFDLVEKDPQGLNAILSGSNSAGPISPTLAGLIHLSRPLLQSDKSIYIRTMRKSIETADTPYRLTSSLPDPAQNLPKYAIVSRIFLPNLARARMMADLSQVDVDGSRIALALVTYKQRYGAYPDTLAQLRSRLGWEIPLDPMSGKEFGYRRKGKGFLLYSVGEDLKDDGGKPVSYHQYHLGAGIAGLSAIPKQISTSSNASGPGDLLWQRDR